MHSDGVVGFLGNYIPFLVPSWMGRSIQKKYQKRSWCRFGICRILNFVMSSSARLNNSVGNLCSISPCLPPAALQPFNIVPCTIITIVLN